MEYFPSFQCFNSLPGMNTTAGSFSLLGSVVPRDAGVVTRLRKAGAIILGVIDHQFDSLKS